MSIQRQTIQRVLNDPVRCQGVVARRLIFCEGALITLPINERILECECCRRLLAYCCACTERRHTEDARNPYFSTDPDFYKPCHHYKMVFVDGACLGNGQDDATAGIDIAIGVKSLTMQRAIPIDDLIDPAPYYPCHSTTIIHPVYLRGCPTISGCPFLTGGDVEHSLERGTVTLRERSCTDKSKLENVCCYY